MIYKKKQAEKKVFTLLTLTIVLGLFFVMAIPLIEFINPSPPDNTITSNKSVEFFTNITEASLKEVKWSWNETNFTIYDTDNLVLAYNFNNLSALGENDTHVFDISGHGNNGTVVGATFNRTGGQPQGNYDGAFEFDGINDFINVSNSSSLVNLGNATNVTFSAWINYNKVSGQQMIFSKENVAFEDRIYLQSTGFNLIGIVEFSNGGNIEVISVNAVQGDENKWIYVSLVMDGSKLSIYKNGILLNSTTAVGYMRLGNDFPLFIGKRQTTDFFNGTIDEVRIWNVSLNSSEIQQLYFSNLKKFDADSWNLYINQSNIFTANASTSYNYFSCAIDSSDNENCTSTRTLTRIPVSITNTANFTASIGDIRNDFYGVNDEYLQFANGSTGNLDNNCDGTRETTHNFTRNRELFEESKMSHVRIWVFDLNVISLSEGVYNETRIQELVDDAEYVNSIGGSITYVGIGTPTWLANTTTGWCNQTSTIFTGDWASCPPTNATKYAEILGRIMGNLTQVIPQGKISLIPQNEPWGNFFLNNLSTDNQIKADESIKIYNVTYDFIKDLYPSISVGGPSYSTKGFTPNLYNTFLSNMTTKIDFVNFHPYKNGSYISSNLIKSELDLLFTDCITFGANCSKVIIDEYDLTNQYLLADDLYSTEMAFVFQSVLNSYPSNVSMLKFKWGARHSYDNCPSLFSEFPIKFPIFIESDNNLSTFYNVTKNFATFHSAGSTVFNSSSTDSAVKSLSTKNGNDFFITIINTDTEARNITIETNGVLTSLVNQETGEVFSDVNGIFNVGVMDSFEILYLGFETPAVTNQASQDICSGFSDAGTTFISFFAIIIIVGVAGLILFLFLGDGDEIDLGAIVFALIIVGFTLSIGASIIFKIGGC